MFFDIVINIFNNFFYISFSIDRLDLEAFDFHQKVYDGYKEVCKLYPNRIKVINGERPIELIIEDVYNDIKKYL
jgi:dTMP kinase